MKDHRHDSRRHGQHGTIRQVDMAGDNDEDRAAGHDSNWSGPHGDVEHVARPDKGAAGPDREYDRDGGKGHQHAQQVHVDFQRIRQAAARRRGLDRMPLIRHSFLLPQDAFQRLAPLETPLPGQDRGVPFAIRSCADSNARNTRAKRILPWMFRASSGRSGRLRCSYRHVASFAVNMKCSVANRRLHQKLRLPRTRITGKVRQGERTDA